MVQFCLPLRVLSCLVVEHTFLHSCAVVGQSRHKIKMNDTTTDPWSISFPLHCSEYNQGCKGTRPRLPRRSADYSRYLQRWASIVSRRFRDDHRERRRAERACVYAQVCFQGHRGGTGVVELSDAQGHLFGREQLDAPHALQRRLRLLGLQVVRGHRLVARLVRAICDAGPVPSQALRCSAWSDRTGAGLEEGRRQDARQRAWPKRDLRAI